MHSYARTSFALAVVAILSSAHLAWGSASSYEVLELQISQIHANQRAEPKLRKEYSDLKARIAVLTYDTDPARMDEVGAHPNKYDFDKGRKELAEKIERQKGLEEAFFRMKNVAVFNAIFKEAKIPGDREEFKAYIAAREKLLKTGTKKQQADKAVRIRILRGVLLDQQKDADIRGGGTDTNTAVEGAAGK